MSGYKMTAVALGPKSGTDRWYEDELARDPIRTPADEIVEPSWASCTPAELNSAIRNTESRVVMAIGSLHLSNQDMPFVSMISWEPPAEP